MTAEPPSRGAAGSTIAAAVLALLPLAPVARAQQEVQLLKGPLPKTFFGASIDAVGDVDGDGHDDVLVGSLYAGFQDSRGYAGVFSGRTAEPIWDVQGVQAGALLGRRVATLGDLDGDGVQDVAISSYGIDLVEIRSGLDGSVLVSIQGAPDSDAGRSLAAAGDIDGDGLGDVIVGAPGQLVGSIPDVGLVRVHSGADGSVLREWSGAVAFEMLGSDVAGPGDLDGDGTPDVVTLSQDVATHVVVLRAHSGADGSLLHETFGAHDFDAIDARVAAAGDLDGDGRPDLVLGTPRPFVSGAPPGRVSVRSGATGDVLHDLTGEQAGDRFGAAVAGAGDIDGDGHDDVLIGATRWAAPGIGEVGRLTLHSGVDMSVLFEAAGIYPGHEFGTAVGAVGDVNGDGYADVAATLPSVFEGLVYVESLRCGTLQVHGHGCPGTSGTAPTLQISGCATRGGSLALLVSDVTLYTTGLLFVGVQGVDLPLGGGCSLYVDPAQLVVPFAVPFGAGGTAQFTAVLPMDVPSGLGISCQAFVVDPNGPKGYTCTNRASFVTL